MHMVMQVRELVVKLAVAEAAAQRSHTKVAGLQVADAEVRAGMPEAERRASELAAECEALREQLKVSLIGQGSMY